jgi:hypothetical protein
MAELDTAVEAIRREMIARGETPARMPQVAPLSVPAVIERLNHVQAIIRDVMRKDVHFMQLPGTAKQTLTKEGSEILLATFQIAVDPLVEDLSTEDVVRYRVRCLGIHTASGTVVGFGLGACSSNEDKYKWRAPVCQEEYDETPETRRRTKWFKGKDRPFKAPQIRTNPEEVANTILKMAKKRAQIDLTLTCLAASDAFRVPAPPKNGGGAVGQHPKMGSAAPGASNAVSQEPSKPAGTGAEAKSSDAPRPATSSQLGLIAKKLDQSGISETYYLATFEIGRPEELPFEEVDAVLKWIQANSP